ncbi:MAG: tRNA (adenosine(37)-N6)-threonylcarbamoyltransferase complex dimerization subunit type 1 TsaB [Oligoflexia bacterium]|nr:tRNA (adenosine(37)-N6)-threonylcarbamoyltransferase complex dimerization subunit type 1 TsaB [Oligoflexia bacterium]
MTWVLALDCSSKFAYGALRHRRSGAQFLFQSAGENSHSESLHSAVRQLLERAGIQCSQLALILLGEGPGSFTGLRIGFSFAQGLALGSQVAVRPFSSFAAAALAFEGAETLRIVLSDARRGECFFSAYLKTGPELKEIIAPQILSGVKIEAAVSEALRARGLAAKGIVAICEQGLELPTIAKARRADLPNLALGGMRLFELESPDIKDDRREEAAALQLAQLTPLYIREVAARKIADRVSGTPILRPRE